MLWATRTTGPSSGGAMSADVVISVPSRLRREEK